MTLANVDERCGILLQGPHQGFEVRHPAVHAVRDRTRGAGGTRLGRVPGPLRRLLAAGALVAVAACSSGDDGDAGSSATTGPEAEVAVAPVASVADVYAVPDPLPPGEPGELIQIEPIAPPDDAPDAVGVARAVPLAFPRG